MFIPKQLGLFVLTAFCLSLQIAEAQTPPPQLSQAQATQIAQSFCQAIGASVTGSGTAIFPAPPRYANEQETYYLPRWRVLFADQAEVEIVDATSVISRYHNFVLSRQLLTDNQPAGTPLSQSDAIQKATTVLQAAGSINDLVSSPTANQYQTDSPATTAGNIWSVVWRRQFQGCPYRDQKVIVLLQAETGAVEGFNLAFPSPPPASATGNVTQEQATVTAQAQLQSVGVQNVTVQACELQVVQPNTFWQPGGSVAPQPNAPGVVAWDCSFVDADGKIYQVWVDSGSGALIGGEVISVAGKRPKPASGPKPLIPPAKSK